eukprot:8825082-Pyramimonas_sp.AAC.1
MQSLFVEAVQNAHDMFRVNRDRFHGHPHSSPVLVAKVRGFDLDDPIILRHPDGAIMGPHSGGRGCPACAGNVNVRSPCHAIGSLNIAGGTAMGITTGSAHAARRTMVRLNL